MNIVVLAGGTSTERDVSIMTSMMVCGSLRRNGHHANMIDVFTGSGKYKHSSEFFQEDNDLKKLADSMKEQSAGIAKLVEERERIGGGFFGPGVRRQISYISDCTVRTVKTERFRQHLI